MIDEFVVLGDAWRAAVPVHALAIGGVPLALTPFDWVVSPVYNAVFDAVWEYRTARVGGAVPWSTAETPDAR